MQKDWKFNQILPFFLHIYGYMVTFLFSDTVSADTGVSATRMQKAAIHLLKTFETADRRSVQRPFNQPERKNWDFWPGQYDGLRFDKISGRRLVAARELLTSGLSELGYSKLRIIQALEKYNPYHSPYYSLLIFGEPSVENPWGWRIQGHHVSLHFTIIDGQVISNTPSFFGTQPLAHPSVDNGRKALKLEEEKAHELFNSLNKNQQIKATISRPFTTYLPNRSEKVEQFRKRGIAYAGLADSQQNLLVDLIQVYTTNMPEDIARQRWTEIKNKNMEDIHFGYEGIGKSGTDHYYRIHGPTFIIEYDCVNDGNHIHVVWRDFRGDFGDDALMKHYQQHH